MERFTCFSLVVVIVAFMGCISAVKCSTFYFGARRAGDAIIMRDVLHTSPSDIPISHTLKFSYPIVKQIATFIEVSSKSNLYGDCSLTFQNNTVFGSATALNVLELQMTIVIYGMNDTRDLQSILTRKYSLLSEHSGFVKRVFDVDNNEYEDAHYDYEDFLEGEKMVLTYGERQEGDKLLHKDFKVGEKVYSLNNSVTFYYIDTNFLTCTKFILPKSNTSNVNFTHLTRHTLKAVVYDSRLPTIEVQMEVYGYRPGDEPVGYNGGPFVSPAQEMPLKSIGSTTIYCIHSLYILSFVLWKINTNPFY